MPPQAAEMAHGKPDGRDRETLISGLSFFPEALPLERATEGKRPNRERKADAPKMRRMKGPLICGKKSV